MTHAIESTHILNSFACLQAAGRCVAVRAVPALEVASSLVISICGIFLSVKVSKVKAFALICNVCTVLSSFFPV